MGKYNGLRGFQASALLLAALASGCATQPKPAKTYPQDMPDAAAGGRYSGTDASGLPRGSGSSDSDIALRDTAPLRYVVKKGDTLWDIANHFLLDPWQWPEIWIVNDQVRNPHLIYPGDVLTLVWAAGRPTVSLDLERMGPRVRILSLEDAIPTIPMELIRDFLRSPRLVTPDQIKKAPYVIDFVDPHIVGGADNMVFVKKLTGAENYRFDGVRVGQRYVDPESGEILGWEAIPVGELEVRDFGAKTATVQIVRSFRETRAGDYLLKPVPELLDANFYPHPPLRRVNARILSVFDGVSQIGQYQVVTLSKGARDGIEVGHVLDILQLGREARDPYTDRREILPDTYAGRLMVFKVESTVSFALVMTAERAIHVLDRAEKPSHR